MSVICGIVVWYYLLLKNLSRSFFRTPSWHTSFTMTRSRLWISLTEGLTRVEEEDTRKVDCSKTEVQTPTVLVLMSAVVLIHFFYSSHHHLRGCSAGQTSGLLAGPQHPSLPPSTKSRPVLLPRHWSGKWTELHLCHVPTRALPDHR